MGQCVTGHPTKEFVPVNETGLVLVRLTRVAGLGPSAAALHPCDLSPGTQLDLLIHLWLQK